MFHVILLIKVSCLKGVPDYRYKETASSTAPYAASVFIDKMEYATGYGSSKKIAKSEAAAKTLEILMPEVGKKMYSAMSLLVIKSFFFLFMIRNIYA